MASTQKAMIEDLRGEVGELREELRVINTELTRLIMATGKIVARIHETQAGKTLLKAATRIVARIHKNQASFVLFLFLLLRAC
jgi:uncharacterized coiled-coil DUF342 family protein